MWSVIIIIAIVAAEATAVVSIVKKRKKVAPADTGVQIPTPGVQEAGLRNKPKKYNGIKSCD